MVKIVIKHIKRQVFHMAFFAFLFMFVGTFAPNVYYRYFDATHYYEVMGVVDVEQNEYYAGDVVEYQFERTAIQDIDFTVQTDLIEVNGDEEINIAGSYPERKVASAGKGTKTISNTRVLPLSIEAGTYKFKFFVNYKIFGHDHIYSYESETFEVIKNPLTNLDN